MANTYEINGFHKLAERDNWDNGCYGPAHASYIDQRLAADTLDELKTKILAFLGADAEAMDIDACDEAGRIDVQTVENDEGTSPTGREEMEFKDGLIDLWAATYTCYVEHVTRQTLPLSGAQNRA